jgi:hypothetical protein
VGAATMTVDPSPRNITYQERYCAFVDILGFSGLIDQLNKRMGAFEEVLTLLRTIHQPPGAMPHASFGDSDFRAQSISDAVCISTMCNNDGLSHMFWVLTLLTMEMLSKGYFVRGAIVKDDLYHDDKIVFGKAQVRAYLLERDIVLYPRIMVTGDVRRDAQEKEMKHFEQFNLADFIAEAADGPYYLDSLAIIPITLRDRPKEERLQSVQRFNAMAEQIQRRFDESRDNPRHFEKVKWFAQYWNVCALGQGITHVYRQGSDGVSRVLV